MKPAKPHLERRWADYQIGRPYLAHAPTKGATGFLGSDCGTVPSEKKGWRLWCFASQDARDKFVASNPTATVL